MRAMLPALRKLDQDEQGHRLLREVSQYPVEVVFAPQRSARTIGQFQWGAYSVTLGTDLQDADDDAQAAVLMHELTHARQLIELGPEKASKQCYYQEIEAFEETARYWRRLHGKRGKRASHWLDMELNETADDFDSGYLEARVLRSYDPQCRRAA